MYDIIYIGGGLNYAGAVVAAKKGLKVALIEKDLQQLGGVCLHKGCIPSKMFLHHAQTLFESHKDLFEGSLKLKLDKMVVKKEKLIQNATKAITAQCAKVDLIEGTAQVVSPNTVAIEEKLIEGKNIVIGTGSSPFIPEGILYDQKAIITSDEVLKLTQLPKTIAVLGSGAIGLEMATYFAAQDVSVTLIVRHEKILKNAHPLIEQALRTQLEKMGITILENHHVLKAKDTYRGVHITFDDEHSRYFEMLLVATGRQPNTDVIATDKIEVQKGIVTDDNFETTLPAHYAIGDCNGKLQLAHAARAEVLFVTHKILGYNPEPINLDHVVKFIHTFPMSYATVGKNKAYFEENNIPYKESIVPLSHFPLSSFYNANEGAVILYADEEGFIAGGEIFAPNAEELIAPVALALAGEMDKALAQKTIMAHPTFSEMVERAYFRL